MRHLALVLIKQESTRFPCKMHAEICGRRMFRWLFDAAVMAKTVTDICVCTNDEEVEGEAVNLKCMDQRTVCVLDQTPCDELAGEVITTKLVPDTIARWRKAMNCTENIAWSTINHLIMHPPVIDACYHKLMRYKIGMVETVEKTDHHHPWYAREMKIDPDGHAMSTCYPGSPEPLSKEYTVSQKFPPVYIRTQAPMTSYSPHRPGPWRALICQSWMSSGVHLPIDLKLAETRYRNRWMYPPLNLTKQ